MQSKHGALVSQSVTSRSDYVYKPYKPFMTAVESDWPSSQNQEKDHQSPVTADSPAASDESTQSSAALLSPLISNMNNDIDAIQHSYMGTSSTGSRIFTAGSTIVSSLSLLIAADRSAYKYESPVPFHTKSPGGLFFPPGCLKFCLHVEYVSD